MECRIGRVAIIRPTEVEVEVLQMSACSSCHAREACTASDMRMRSLTVTRDHSMALSVGDRVQIIAEQPRILTASAYAYVIPLIILLLEALLLPRYLGVGDLPLVGILLTTVALYGGVLWLLRDHFRRIFTFHIRPLGRQSSGTEYRDNTSRDSFVR